MLLKKYDKVFKIIFAAIFLSYVNLFAINQGMAQINRDAYNEQWKFFKRVAKVGGFANPDQFSSTAGVVAIVASIVSVVLSIVGSIFIILVIYGGFLWLTARGNKDITDKARKIITDAVIGAAIVIGAYVITYFIVQALALSIEP